MLLFQTVNQEQSEMTPDRATDAPGPSDARSDVAVVHDRFGNGLGEIRDMSSFKVGEISWFFKDLHSTLFFTLRVIFH